MNYLIVTLEGGGNIPPVLSILRKLVAKGHSVYLLSEPWFRELAELNGAKFIPFKAYFLKSDRKKDIMEDWKDKNNTFKNVIFGPIRTVALETKAAIENFQIDAVIADALMPGALIGAEAMNIPRVALFHMPEYLPGPNRPPGGLGLSAINNPFGRIRDTMLTTVFNFVFDKFLPQINNVRVENGLNELKHTSDLFHNADLRIIQTSSTFDLPISPAPKNVRYTGPVLDDPDWAKEWVNPWPEKDPRPLVVVSLSSTFQNQAQTIANCIIALGSLPVRGLVTLGLAIENENLETPENVKIIPNGSHDQIFPHASCVITHAGHGTVMRALANGVPLLCLPMGRDQADNAAKVVYHGVGKRISAGASPSKIGKAVSNILATPAYKERASKLGAIIKLDADNESSVTELENLFQIHA